MTSVDGRGAELHAHDEPPAPRFRAPTTAWGSRSLRSDDDDDQPTSVDGYGVSIDGGVVVNTMDVRGWRR
jgi:hypothetical protein